MVGSAVALLIAIVLPCCAQELAPTVIPAHPKPYFSWAKIPTAFHGANKSGIYSDDAVKLLVRNQMVTIESKSVCEECYLLS